MAVVLIQKQPEGFTSEMYDSVNAHVDVEGNPPEGMIAHAIGADADGTWRIVDFWESREAHDRFVQERLWPAIQDALRERGMDPDQAPDIERFFFDAHHMMVAGAPAPH